MYDINFISAADAAVIAVGIGIAPINLTEQQKTDLAVKLTPVLIAYTANDPDFAGVIVYESEDAKDVNCFVFRDNDGSIYLCVSTLCAEAEKIAFTIIATESFVRADEIRRDDTYLGPIEEDPFDAAIAAAQAAQAAAEAAQQAMLAAARVLVSLDRFAGAQAEEGPADED